MRRKELRLLHARFLELLFKEASSAFRDFGLTAAYARPAVPVAFEHDISQPRCS